MRCPCNEGHRSECSLTLQPHIMSFEERISDVRLRIQDLWISSSHSWRNTRIISAHLFLFASASREHQLKKNERQSIKKQSRRQTETQTTKFRSAALTSTVTTTTCSLPVPAFHHRYLNLSSQNTIFQMSPRQHGAKSRLFLLTALCKYTSSRAPFLKIYYGEWKECFNFFLLKSDVCSWNCKSSFSSGSLHWMTRKYSQLIQ